MAIVVTEQKLKRLRSIHEVACGTRAENAELIWQLAIECSRVLGLDPSEESDANYHARSIVINKVEPTEAVASVLANFSR